MQLKNTYLDSSTFGNLFERAENIRKIARSMIKLTSVLNDNIAILSHLQVFC